MTNKKNMLYTRTTIRIHYNKLQKDCSKIHLHEKKKFEIEGIQSFLK
jgi:hypothetical protein